MRATKRQGSRLLARQSHMAAADEIQGAGPLRNDVAQLGSAVQPLAGAVVVVVLSSFALGRPVTLETHLARESQDV
jgi:hypothetical protein